MNTDTLKVLCLHGYRQNETKFRTQTGALRKVLKKHMDLIFISAPHTIPNTPIDEDQRSWWFTANEGSFSAADQSETSFGLQTSIDHLSKVFETQGPFDGLLGFSQGACFAGILASMRQINQLPTVMSHFRFIISISGFRSKCLEHSRFYNEPIMLPSLHVIGETDRVIDPAWSFELAEDFQNATIMKHNGGHFVPGHGSLKEDYLKFCQQLK